MSDMSVAAARAYLQAAQVGKSTMSSGPTEAQGAGGFGDMLTGAMQQASNAGQQAETAITSAAMGRTDLVDVVTAVAAAEATLETVVAVRDEVIKAYQEILRMPI